MEKYILIFTQEEVIVTLMTTLAVINCLDDAFYHKPFLYCK